MELMTATIVKSPIWELLSLPLQYEYNAIFKKPHFDQKAMDTVFAKLPVKYQDWIEERVTRETGRRPRRQLV